MPELRTFSPANANIVLSDKDISNYSYSVVVVGAGVMGAWIALYCLRKGCKVRLYDKWGPGNSLSSSGGESRLIRAIYGEGLLYSQLTHESISKWKELETKVGKKLFHQTGIHWLLSEDLPDLYEPSQQFLGKKHPIHSIEKVHFQQKYPFVNVKDIAKILLEESAGYILARQAVIETVKQFISEGGEYHSEEISVDETRDGVKLNGERSKAIDADIKILSVGPWIKDLLPNLQASIKVTRQEVHYYSFPKMQRQFTPWVDYNPDDMFYGVWDHGNRGIKVAHDERGPEIQPDSENRTASLGELEASLKYMLHRFPGLGQPTLSESRICQYTNTNDGNIILDRHPNDSRTVIVGGGSGHSFKFGPAIGRLAYEIGTEQRPVPTPFKLA